MVRIPPSALLTFAQHARGRAASRGPLHWRCPALASTAKLTRSAMSLRCLERQAPVPHHSLAALKHGDLLFACEPLDVASPLDAAIQAIGHKTSEWLHERGAQISHDITAEHVGMVIADSMGHAVSVVEAVRVAGVRVLPLWSFFNEFARGTKFYHGQLRGVSAVEARQAVSFATLRLGAPYAEDFSPPSPYATTPHSQAFYCSSLVDYAYRSALGKELVFTTEPFPLIFEPRDFWVEYYEKQNLPVPKGFGSNPTLLLHSSMVEFSLLDLDDDEKNLEDIMY